MAISRQQLRSIARARLRDAQALLRARRYDGAVYLCGYAVEIALKARICRALGWADFPEDNREFDGYQSLRTHRLDVLLRFSGLQARVKTRMIAEWSLVEVWRPEMRYRRVGTAGRRDAANMITAATRVVSSL